MYGSSRWPGDFSNSGPLAIASSCTPDIRFSHQSTGSNSSSDDSYHHNPRQPGYNNQEEQWLSSSPTQDCFQQDYIQAPNAHRVADAIPSGHILQWNRYVAVSAQWVYCGENPKVPILARVSITDYKGSTILDTFVRPTSIVTDYRYTETGLQAFHLTSAPYISDVQAHVQNLIQNKIIIGYQLWNFLSLLQFTHPAVDTRDIASFIPFRKSLQWRRTSIVPLPILVAKLMGRGFAKGYEHPLENARACLDLFRSSHGVWEDLVQQGYWPCSTVEDVPAFAYGCFT